MVWPEIGWLPSAPPYSLHCFKPVAKHAKPVCGLLLGRDVIPQPFLRTHMETQL